MKEFGGEAERAAGSREGRDLANDSVRIVVTDIVDHPVPRRAPVLGNSTQGMVTGFKSWKRAGSCAVNGGGCSWDEGEFEDIVVLEVLWFGRVIVMIMC